jgi:non-ribosomal peptide synthetase component F
MGNDTRPNGLASNGVPEAIDLSGARVLNEQICRGQETGVRTPRIPKPFSQYYSARKTGSGTLEFRFHKLASASLDEFVERGGLTPLAVFLTATSVLLGRYSGQKQLLIDTAISIPGSGRRPQTTRPGLAIPVDLSRDPTFMALLMKTQETLVAVGGRRRTGPDAGNRERQQSGSTPGPFARGSVVVQDPANSGGENFALAHTGNSAFALSFVRSTEGWQGSLSFDPSAIRPDEGEQLVGYLSALLWDSLAYSENRISRLRVLDEDQRLHTIASWNLLSVDSIEHCVHELFERQVEERPKAVALTCGSQTLTYEELNRRANKLARYLRRRGVAPEVVVGVCLQQPTVEAAVSTIAILKAGGVYLHLNPAFPSEYLLSMVRTSKARLVAVASRHRSPLAIDDSQCICLDEVAAEVNKESDANVKSGVTADNAAFLTIAPDETRRPQCSVNIHRSITNRLALIPLPDIEQGDICCLNSSLLFLSRLFVPLVLGASVIAVGDDQFKDMKQLARTIETHRISSLFFGPGVLQQLLDLGGAHVSRLRSLRAVAVGGNALPPAVVERFRELLPQAVLISLYGDSEVGATTTIRTMTGDCASGSGSIGWPAANTRVYLLDTNLDPVPAGLVGEMYIGSSCLARGYSNRPDLTAARFVADPFGLTAGERLYRTGELGRYRTTGELEFVARPGGR